MTAIQNLACLWTLFLTQTVFVCSGIQFLERHEGEAVVLPCVIQQRNPSPFGVYLKRSWLKPSKVLFMHAESDFSVEIDDDKQRISVSGNPSNHSLKVTISQLRVSDTDRYYCEFVVNNPFSEDERIHGRTEFFLLITAGHCSCSSYSTLLYALSSAVGVLFLLVLIGFVVIYQGKAHRSVKSHPQAPIYEEMSGVQPVNQKLSPRHLEETESSEYRNFSLRKTFPENHYESPSGALYSRT